MKKILSLIVMLCMPLMACSTDYKEGEHYTVVNEQATKKAEVREYFSFYCPHCFKFEPIMEGVKKSLPENAKFELNHVDFLRAASPKVQGLLSKAIVVAKQMDMEKKLVGAIFNYIQTQRAVITSEKDIRNIFVLNGADGEKFDKLMASFSVNSKVKLMKKNQNYFSKKKGLDGKPYLNSVPTVIVNGKYKINPSALKKNDFVEDYKKIVNYLLTLK